MAFLSKTGGFAGTCPSRQRDVCHNNNLNSSLALPFTWNLMKITIRATLHTLRQLYCRRMSYSKSKSSTKQFCRVWPHQLIYCYSILWSTKVVADTNTLNVYSISNHTYNHNINHAASICIQRTERAIKAYHSRQNAHHGGAIQTCWAICR